MRGTYPAFPVVAEGGPNSGLNAEIHVGMDTRTYVAVRVLQGLLASPALQVQSPTPLADEAVRYTDALLERLEQPETPAPTRAELVEQCARTAYNAGHAAGIESEKVRHIVEAVKGVRP